MDPRTEVVVSADAIEVGYVQPEADQQENPSTDQIQKSAGKTQQVAPRVSVTSSGFKVRFDSV